MTTLYEKINAAADFIRSQSKIQPIIGIVLGSGLGGLTEEIKVDQRIRYADIPHFPTSTVKGHGGFLTLGTMEGKPVVAMSGRFHYYEGYSMKEVTFPIRVMKALGVRTLFLSNAAGGMNSNFKVGDIVLIKDHINLTPENPLRGENDERLGTRFPDMSEPYNLQLLTLAEKVAKENNIPVQRGVYAGVPGPNFETRSEYKYLHAIGADAVGMSTVPETIVAVHAQIKVMAASIITDVGIREEDNTISHEEVLEAAEAAAPKLALLFKETIAQLPR